MQPRCFDRSNTSRSPAPKETKKFVYEGIAEVVTEEMDVTAVPSTRTKIMLNLANPAAAFRWWRLPADGVGLARIEFVIANQVKVHPMALIHFDELTDEKPRPLLPSLRVVMSTKRTISSIGSRWGSRASPLRLSETSDHQNERFQD